MRLEKGLPPHGWLVRAAMALGVLVVALPKQSFGQG